MTTAPHCHLTARTWLTFWLTSTNICHVLSSTLCRSCITFTLFSHHSDSWPCSHFVVCVRGCVFYHCKYLSALVSTSCTAGDMTSVTVYIEKDHLENWLPVWNASCVLDASLTVQAIVEAPGGASWTGLKKWKIT